VSQTPSVVEGPTSVAAEFPLHAAVVVEAGFVQIPVALGLAPSTRNQILALDLPAPAVAQVAARASRPFVPLDALEVPAAVHPLQTRLADSKVSTLNDLKRPYMW